MSNLVEFLNARLDEDEQLALAAEVDFDMTRVLADVAAKRQIVAFLDTSGAPEGEGKYVAGCTLLLLAQPYREHPDYGAIE